MNDDTTPIDTNPEPPAWYPAAPAPAPTPAPTKPARFRIASIAVTAFMVGCGVASVGTAAVVADHAAGQDSASQVAPTGENFVVPDQSQGQSQNQQGQSQNGDGSGQSTDPFSGLGGFGGFDPFGDLQGGSGTQGATSDSTSDATADQSQGLVEITSTLSNGTAAGTGMILTSSGIVVTNHHVVAGATSVKVTDVSTGKAYTATYVGGDATTDVAILKLADASGLTPVELSSSAAAVGDEITSVGDAGGDGGSLTAAPGTVSALDQNITVSDDDGGSSNLTDLIEMAAYVVPGDSGGAVLDAEGNVVGMNVAASSGGTDVVGYAIPIKTVETIATEILDGTRSSDITYGYPGYLGVGLDPQSTGSGALVGEVAQGGAAEDAGIVAGDTITAVDGQSVGSPTELRSLIARTAPGDKATITWTTSSGSTKRATVTLGTGPIA